MRVAIEHVSKSFGRRDRHLALSNISLVAEDGEFLVLLGPSGSGKTTLLRAIAGLETIDSGNIRFGAQRVNDLSPGSRNIGMVFQDYALYPHLSVRHNIAYNMKIRKLARGEVERRVIEAATMLGIERLLARKPSELSGGERQRVAVGRAITRDASVLLMDEPLSNLDAQIREHVRVELRELQRRLGVTTIYVTHDQVEAMVMADRIAVMSEGKVEQLGSPDEVYGRPDTLFCARFVGSPKINELRGRIRSIGGSALEFGIAGELTAAGVTLSLEAERSDGIELPSKDAILAFRAEDVEITDAADRGANGGLEVDVALIENRGAEKYVVAELSKPWRVAQVSAELRARIHGATEITAQQVAFLPKRVHVFTEATGHRLVTARCIAVLRAEAQHAEGARSRDHVPGGAAAG